MLNFNQLTFLNIEDITFGNGPILSKDIPEDLKSKQDIKKITKYNNLNHGVITGDFFIWALENDISYESVRWFINSFSNQNNDEINSIVDAFFNKYKIYFDESSNCVKFRFKDENGLTNVNWFNDFVLAGVAYDTNGTPFDINTLFLKFNLQKNIIDVKLKHIVDYNGEDNNRFINILKSDKVTMLFESLFQSDSIYMHWSTQSLLYFSLVDIVDSVLNIPLYNNDVKNLLYRLALKDPSFMSLLAKYNYPNIKNSEIDFFCNGFITWIETLKTDNSDQAFLLELLRQGVKSAKRNRNLIFLNNNTDKLLIENFVPNYALRLSTFPNSEVCFDQCGIVEENIESYIKAYCINKIPTYQFLNSKKNRWIQLSDMISGVIGAYMAYLNTNDISKIEHDLNQLNETQLKNMILFIKLKLKSVKRNRFFDHMSIDYQQIERMIFLKEWCINKKIK